MSDEDDNESACSRVKGNVNKVGCTGSDKIPWFGNDLNWIKGICKQQIYHTWKKIIGYFKQ